MTKEEIKKVLECCEKYAYCKDCPCYTYCEHELHKGALVLITEQEKEIERLKSEIIKQDQAIIERNFELVELEDKIKQAKIEVLTELRNKCHNYYPSIDHYCCSVKAVNLSDINKMIEELKK